MANDKPKFPCGNAELPSTSDESDDELFYKKRIMLIADNKEIGVQAIKNLCTRFGELVKPIHVPVNNKNWFFAEYGTASEAVQAIRYINENPNLRIRAQFSKKRQNYSSSSKANRSNNNQPIAPDNTPIPIQMENRRIHGPFATNIGVNRFANVLDADTKMEAQKNILENGGAYCRPSDDRFKVLNGRTAFRESGQNLASIQAMAERSQGTYDAATHSYGHNMDVVTGVVVGPCTKCGRVSERQCEVCMDPYCSPECQRLDWPTHKKVCRPMPALVLAVAGPEMKIPSKPVEKVVPFLPLPTPNSQLFGVQPTRKPMPTAKSQTSPVSEPQPDPSASPSSQIANMPLQEEIELIKQKIRSTMVKDQPQHAPLPRSGEHVVITAAPSSGVLYLRAIDKASDLGFRQVLQEVTRYAATVKNLERKPKRGDYVLALFEDVYYRANVLTPSNGCSDDAIKVAYIDFGNMALVKWRDCKSIDSSEVVALTRHNFKVYLLNVDYTKHTNDATIKLINQCVDEMVEFELRYEGTLPIKEKREVTLIRVSDKMSLNARVKELATVKPPKLDDDEAIFGYNDLTVKDIPICKAKQLLVVDASLLHLGQFTCILQTDLPNWQACLQKVTDYCDTLSDKDSYMPRENELCLARYVDEDNEKSWYRGMCTESVGDKHPTITFIDFGNMTPVAVEDIRKIPKELVQLPSYATPCRVKGLPEDLANYLPLFEKMFVAGKEISIDEVEHEVMCLYGVKSVTAILTIDSLNL